MIAMLYNSSVKQRLVLIDGDGRAFSAVSHSDRKVREERGVDLDKLLDEGWQIISVTPIATSDELQYLLVLEQRVRDQQGSKGT